MGYVYLIESINSGMFKIGVTKNHPSKRVKQLSTGNDSELVIIGFFECEHYHKLEKWLHRKHSEKKVNGEWFALTEEDIMTFMNDCHQANETINLLIKENPFYK